jgi:hypothetical protein
MGKYYLQIIALKGCPHSNASIELANNINAKYHKIIKIDYHEKENHKTPEISTFPQIYLMKENGGSLLLGGNDKFQSVYNTFKNEKNYDSHLEIFLKGNINWNKKSVLRLINILNS